MCDGEKRRVWVYSVCLCGGGEVEVRVCEGGSECGGDSGCMCVYVIVSVEVGVRGE